MAAALAAVSLLACPPEREAPPRSRAPPLRVAMLLPGHPEDDSWSQTGFEGLKLIERELGAQIAWSAGVGEGDAAELLRRYAREGFDLVVGQGGEYIPGAELVADEFPRTKFAVVAGHPGNNRNLGSLSFRDGELGYLCGVVAAMKTRTKKVAFLGGVAYPHVKEQAVLFARAVKATDPEVEVTERWVESWSDEEQAAAITRQLLEAGVDVLLVDADTGGNGAFRELSRAGALAIGWSVDQHELAPDVILTSGIQRVPVMLLEAATLVREGRFEGKQYEFGLREGAQDLAPFYGLLSPEEAGRVAAVEAQIREGTLDVAP